MTDYDVVIVGAGPAGSFLSYKLKNKGISVLLLEKKKFPRYKSCAGGLSKKAYDILYSENKDIEKIVEMTAKKGFYVRNGKFTFTNPGKDLIFMTYRSDLDNFLVKIAVDNKTVNFKDEVTVKKIKTEESSIVYFDKGKDYKVKYKILVGAWGGNIHFNKLIGLNPIERFDLSSSWEGPAGPKFSEYKDEYVLSQTFKKYPGFVCYIFPKSDLITAGIFTSKYPFPDCYKKLWIEFMDFWKLDKKIKPNYAVIPIRDPKKPVAKDNILLIGDAAGLADSFTGEGLYHDFVNSEIAAKHIRKYFKNKKYDLASKYNKNIDHRFNDFLRWANRYESLFHRFPNFSFWLGSEFPPGNDVINSFITGEIKYNEINKILKCFYNGFKKECSHRDSNPSH